MPACRVKRALFSLSDKTGLVELARALHSEFNVELISTGGSARTLRDAGLPVTDVSAITGFPEMLDGRVKTLHPRIHAALLADQTNPEHLRQLREQGIEPIDLLAVHLYPFEQTVEQPDCTHQQALEQIDIGGPALLRAAAKNTLTGPIVLCDLPEQADELLDLLREEGDVPPDIREHWAARVWGRIRAYDQAIEDYFDLHFLKQNHAVVDIDPTFTAPHETPAESAGRLVLGTFNCLLESVIEPAASLDTPPTPLRYGENPHQHAVLLPARRPASQPRDTSLGEPLALADVLQSEMSYNNWLDLDAAAALLRECSIAFPHQACAVIVKHTNACGLALRPTAHEAFDAAYLGDARSAAGGVLAINRPVDNALARQIMTVYQRAGKAAGAGFFKLDAWLAPHFDPDALDTIRQTSEKRTWGTTVRLVQSPIAAETAPLPANTVHLRTAAGGLLLQRADLLTSAPAAWEVHCGALNASIQRDLQLAEIIAKHAKSNAIAIVNDGQLLAAGVGQTSRVISAKLAVLLANENGHQTRLRNAVAASDAFFPMPDAPETLLNAGISTILHPGGGQKDQLTLELCQQRHATLVTTAARHFRH